MLLRGPEATNRLKRTRASVATITVALLISCALALLGSCGPPTLSQKIDMYLWEKYDALTFSGSVLVALDGKIILRKGYGMADHERGLLNTPETKHRICSISKVFTSLAIMTLCEQGLVTLEDTVDRFYNGFPNGESITLRHLMDHTSGLYDIHNEDPAFDQVARHAKSLDELIATFRDKPLKWIPGSAYGYSNSGYILLAGIIEKAAGKSYGDYLREALFEPLDMYSSGDYRNQHVEDLAIAYIVRGDRPVKTDDYHWSNFTGSGSLYSTVDDLYRLHQGLMSEKVVSRESLGKAGNFLAAFGHLPGLSSGMVRFPSQDLVVILLGNFNDTVEGMCHEIAKMALTHGAKAPEPHVLEQYAGTYETPRGETIVIELRKGRLVASMSGTSSQELLAIGPGPEGSFLMGNVIVRFIEAEDGTMEIQMPDFEGTPTGSLGAIRVDR
jgi:CubicO group peptidase (beta-lactamase class C family)